MMSPEQARDFFRKHFAEITPEQFLEEVKLYSPEILEPPTDEEIAAQLARPVVLISYGPGDALVARWLAQDLRHSAFRVLLPDRVGPSADYDVRDLRETIAQADVVVALLSAQAVRSKLLGRHLQIAAEQNRRIVPVVLEDVDIPVHLRGMRHVDMSRSYLEGFGQLDRALRYPE